MRFGHDHFLVIVTSGSIFLTSTFSKENLKWIKDTIKSKMEMVICISPTILKGIRSNEIGFQEVMFCPPMPNLEGPQIRPTGEVIIFYGNMTNNDTTKDEGGGGRGRVNEYMWATELSASNTITGTFLCYLSLTLFCTVLFKLVPN